MQVWDHDSFTAHDRIGIARCSLCDIQTGLEIPLMADEQNNCATNGVLIFEMCRLELKYFKFGGMANPALIRFYAEHVWNLPKPEVNSTCVFASLSVRASLFCSLACDRSALCWRVHIHAACVCARANTSIFKQMPRGVGKRGSERMHSAIPCSDRTHTHTRSRTLRCSSLSLVAFQNITWSRPLKTASCMT